MLTLTPICPKQPLEGQDIPIRQVYQLLIRENVLVAINAVDLLHHRLSDLMVLIAGLQEKSCPQFQK
jgi:hypothetical protein